MALLGVSLALHVAAAIALRLRPIEPAPVPHEAPIELEFVVEVPPVEPPAPSIPEPQRAPEPPQKKRPKQQEATASAPAQTEPGQATQGDGAPAGVGERGDLPVASRPSLTPSAGFAMSLGTSGVPREEPRGTTVRNGPGETLDPVDVNAWTSDKLTRKLNNDLAQDVGAAAVAAGNVPAHFKRYETAMRTALPRAKIDVTPLTAKEGLAEVAGALFGGAPSAEAQKRVADSPLGRSVQQQTVMMPNVDDQKNREAALGMLAAGEAIKERIQRARLRTVLEMTVDTSGALADVSIIEHSGDARFDESVLHFSRKIARSLPDSDEKLLGSTMWKTRWQFTYEFPQVKVRLLNAWRVGALPMAQ